ncbi:Re/Si-specific NAD(P)(+) transhydrogenase subunit alpha [Rhodoferax sp.]|uniref:Re/Si-specific NAD(P)(+) transhydrogenase subunit alpha n=1 Tax=Rhodoferax sp. TaxID=50421 RepID=UPI0027281DC9|nr:Re/Si-specific NAD(P)(+) transhydrogenase subunit alpha [Rhodoferax sp.]MDO9144625.1 Re/Si-specific NAD(P)(+) transhydrogenase subunit alpha [Rhodoferax sp.]MDP2442967.1 Re/Si-specific NAD(P)(+) transhydrogenase subunit alpha [Rhodoferax sp.]MDZ4206491.1 Re/Si-specific NAD(P)(+) transhydrogenase subunit alpha [Rhodoferax sp.]
MQAGATTQDASDKSALASAPSPAQTAQRIGVPREIFPGEKRVATVPEAVEKLIKLGFSVAVEAGAGDAANCSDDTYRAAGATVAESAAALWSGSDIVFKVRPPSADEVAQMRAGQVLIGFIWPAQNPDLMQQLSAKKVTVLAIDALPRMLSRAQKMDALTSQAGVAGYRAVIEAANAFGRFFNGQITAAGKVPPAKVFIAGAGVAGLAAIGTAAGLGAIVRANDTRAEVADQVVSLGGEFVKVDYEEEGSGGGGYAKVMSEGFQQAQRAMYAKQAREVDIIITTALIPGKPAPKLITAEMVQSMKPGSVIVDMAAEQGGNCELTEPGQVVVKHGVTIVGYTDLVSRLAKQSSTLYATNLFRLTEELCKTKDGVVNVNMEDDAIRGLTVIKNGEVTWPAPAPKQAAAPAPAAAKPAAAAAAKKGHGHGGGEAEPMAGSKLAIMFGVAAALFWLIGSSAPPAFLSHFTVFVLACFVGYMVVWNVKPALHTPLMSVTNAISSIIAIGALVQVSPWANAADRPNDLISWVAAAAIVLTAINMFGGFAVTQRMLAMFRK